MIAEDNDKANSSNSLPVLPGAKTIGKKTAANIKVIDTTGAGDAFVGAFSYALSMKMNTEDSLKLGLEKATNSVTKKGTQSSYKD